MESYLKSYKDIDVVVCQNDNEAFGAIDALKAAGKTLVKTETLSLSHLMQQMQVLQMLRTELSMQTLSVTLLQHHMLRTLSRNSKMAASLKARRYMLMSLASLVMIQLQHSRLMKTKKSQ